ncbi:MAG: hypothetical protein EP338_07645 [Bacteroidetes bacterium]|nr:MAG: hypothetical protein EP338_07645 [Bacteroidota bacterium]
MKHYLYTGICLLFFLKNIQAQEDKVAPKYSNEFLQIGIGADALGRGNSVVASSKGVNSGYWNPAGLIHSSEFAEIGLMHSEYFAGIAKYDYLGFSKTIHDPGSLEDQSAIGFSLIRFAVDDIPNTTQLINQQGQIDYSQVTSFTAADFAFIASYARKLPIDGLNVGANFKVIRRKVGDFAKSWGFGLDAGAQYKKNENLQFGLMFRDVTSTFNAWIFDLDNETQEVFIKTGNELPSNGLELTLPRMILGTQYRKELGKKGIYLEGELDLTFTFDGKRNTLIKSNFTSIDPTLGIQLGFKEFFSIKAGLINIQQVSDIDKNVSYSLQPNIGFGLAIKNFYLDYAFTDIGDQSIALYSHVISLRLKLAPPTNSKKR